MTKTASNIEDLASLMSSQIELFRQGKYDQAINIFAQTCELSNSLSPADLQNFQTMTRIRDLLNELKQIIDAELAQTGADLTNVKTARKLLQKYNQNSLENI